MSPCHIGSPGRLPLGWSGGAKVFSFQCRGVLLIWIIVGQGPIALAVGAGGGCMDIFSLIYLFSLLSPSWKTARYRLYREPPKRAQGSLCICRDGSVSTFSEFIDY